MRDWFVTRRAIRSSAGVYHQGASYAGAGPYHSTAAPRIVASSRIRRQPRAGEDISIPSHPITNSHRNNDNKHAARSVSD
eukprot:9414446-Pyramimonas_sp.AAC.1